jgi:DNA-binding transcriptional regulator YdaS (Cro superfamily)
MSAIIEAINKAGTQESLALKLGVSQQAVSGWVKDGHVPLRRAVQIESIFGVPAIKLVDQSLVNLLGKCPNCDE